MDLSDFFEFDFPLKNPGPRGQKIIRVLFGVFLAALCSPGVWKGLQRGFSETNWLLNAASTFLFVSLILFGLLTVALGLKRKWPAWLVPISFAAVFATRLLFGP